MIIAIERQGNSAARMKGVAKFDPDNPAGWLGRNRHARSQRRRREKQPAGALKRHC
ncbi:hypothetical protein [Allosphingosinicella sp.]|uniref:hypothetical protein n=1 Tax=Allosphingosinicella sp. TaxID=2823234 RepID=UPI003784895F